MNVAGDAPRRLADDRVVPGPADRIDGGRRSERRDRAVDPRCGLPNRLSKVTPFDRRLRPGGNGGERGVRVQEDIAAGGERPGHDRGRRFFLGRDALHRQGVGDDESVVHPRPPKKPRQHRRGERRRRPGRIERGNGDVPGHHRADARLLRAKEGKKLDPFQAFPVGSDDRQLGVRIDGRISVAGEVLGAGQDERPPLRVVRGRPLDLADELLDVPGDFRRIFAERA